MISRQDHSSTTPFDMSNNTNDQTKDNKSGSSGTQWHTLHSGTMDIGDLFSMMALASGGQKRSEKERQHLQKLRVNVEAMFPPIDDTGKRGFATARLLASRESLIDAITDCMHEGASYGFMHRHPLEPSWIDIMNKEGFELWRDTGNTLLTVVLMPGANEAVRTKVLSKGKFVRLPEPVVAQATEKASSTVTNEGVTSETDQS